MAELNDPVIGGKLDSGVIKQLERRKDIVSKRSNRTSEELQYLNNTGWVKLTSSVNTELLNFKGKKEYSNILAKNNIMFSGTSSDSGGIRGGFGSSYSTSETLGERPMAGITAVQVTSQNTFGTLKLATINITINSIEQLDTLEALFMRPGFTALLEYGHTVYPDNNSDSIITSPEQIDSFFTPSNRSDIQNLIKEKKKSSSNNYDAMYGVIKNFVWNMNTDGGYDCKVDLISVGEILESIQVNISPNSVLTSDPFAAKNDTSKNSIKYSTEYKTTAIHAYLNLIKFSGIKNSYYDENVYSNTSIESISVEENLNNYMGDFYERISNNLKIAGIPKSYPAIGITGTQVSEFGSFTKYISIAQILNLINETFLLKDNNGLLFSFFIGEEGKVRTPFLTFQGHFALDPMIAVLPKPAKLGILSTAEPTWDDLLRYNITEKASTVPTHGQFNDILGIYLNIDYVISCLDATIATENATNKSLRDFINKLLNGLQNTLGDINDFDLHFDEDTSTYYVIDRKVTPDDNKLKGSKIELIGLNSIVQNLTLVSKLTSSISTIMAVSAQATSSDIAQDTLSLQKWQEGLKDRHSETKQLSPQKQQLAAIEKTKKDKEKVEADLRDWRELKTLVDKFNTSLNKGSLDYNKGEIQGAAPSHKAMTVKLLEFNTRKKKISPAGLIPLELTLTIQGLGGLKIGQAFTISEELLPTRYRNNVAFLITGLDHSIRNNRWTTDIKAQMIIISRYDKEVEINIEEINNAYQYFKVSPDLTKLINWKKPLTTLTLRNDDSGLGHYGAPRKGGTHTGIDYLAAPGTPAFSPIDGTARAGSKEYSDGHPGTTSVVIQGSGEYAGYGVVLGYVEGDKAGILPGKLVKVKAGQPVGYVQNMKQYYPNDPDMLNHMHFAVYVGTDTFAKIDTTELKFQ